MGATSQRTCESQDVTDRSAWWRNRAGVIAWCVLTVAAAGTAWASVAVVRNNTTGPIPVAVNSGDVSGAATPSGGSSPRASASRSTPPAATTRTIRSPGGTLAVACSGAAARLIYATPADGWRMQPDKSSADRIRVFFVQGTTGYRVSGRCHDGGVEAEVERDTPSGESPK